MGRNSQQAPCLELIPPEVLQIIALSLGLTHPPSLVSLLCCSSKFYQKLSPSHNHQLYAQLFKYNFDVDAIQRRFGRMSVSSTALSNEYCKRMLYMKQMRKSVLSGALPSQDLLEAHLWLSYLMVLEHDQKNVPMLYNHATIKEFLALHYKERFYETALSPGYAPATVDRSLALHLMYLLAFNDNESLEELNERFFVLKPYVFAAHKYDAFFAPWNISYLPLYQNGNEQQQNTPKQPLVPKTCYIHHVGMKIPISPPIISHAAILCFFARLDRSPDSAQLYGNASSTAAYLANDPSIGTNNNNNNSGNDVLGLNRDGAHEGEDEDEDEDQDTTLGLISIPPPQLSSSSFLDLEFQRLQTCHDPNYSTGLSWKDCRGLFQGAWEGRFSYFDFDSYREMLGGRIRSLYEGPFGDQPQVWKIEERIVKLKPDHRSRSQIPWISDSDFNTNSNSQQQQKQQGSSQKLSPSPSTQTHHHQQRSFSSSSASDDQTQFSASLDYDNLLVGDVLEDIDADNLDYVDNDSSYEIILTGTGHSAWGQFSLKGRVRPWDGTFIIAKTYAPDTRGVWVYRGYLHHASGCLLGRWRDTFTGEHMHGYEGTFTMRRRV